MTVLHGRSSTLCCLTLLFLVSGAKAGSIQDKFFFSVAGGINSYNTHDTHLVVSPFETDKNKVNKSSMLGAWKLGVGYAFCDNSLPYINKLSINLNLYQTSATLSGDVWQYELPQFNNYSFKAPVTSTRLMLDIKPSLYVYESMQAYLILGVGAAWNTVSYKETITAADVDPNSNFSLSKRTTSQVAYDLGLGAQMPLTANLDLSLEYVYAIMGRGSPAYNSENIRLESTPKFLLQSQSLMLGLVLKL